MGKAKKYQTNRNNKKQQEMIPPMTHNLSQKALDVTIKVSFLMVKATSNYEDIKQDISKLNNKAASFLRQNLQKKQEKWIGTQ